MKPVDALVVLGAWLQPDGRLGAALAERVVAGVDAWRAGLAPTLVMTGAREAQAMRRRALELGVPDSAIILENRALTTRENALFSAEILRQRGLGRVLVVTQEFHRVRAVGAFRRLGVDASALEFESRPSGRSALLREAAGRFWYRLRGWL